MSARERGMDKKQQRQVDREMDNTSTLGSLKDQMKANLQGLDDAINVIDKNGRYRQRQERRKRAQRAMEKDWAAKQRQENKLVLSAEERLERQTTQIGKIIRDAIVRHPSQSGNSSR